MLKENDIEINIKSQGYESQSYAEDLEKKRTVLIFKSMRRSKDVSCPFCSSRVYEDGMASEYLKDIPLYPGKEFGFLFQVHRYECTSCHKKFTESIPQKYEGTRITIRAAAWIKGFLLNKVSIRSIQNITGIHWDTIRKIHKETMETSLEEYNQRLLTAQYHPHFLAVDEFAIHKGHTYATCVMDLETGYILWVGSGRSMSDFKRFFEEVEPSFLAEVRAIAMDMNASYHQVVKEKLPQVQIVYDRYHMQAQFGKEVLGVVRLEEARKHKEHSLELLQMLQGAPSEQKQQLHDEIRREKAKYSEMKKLRWTLLTNGAKLSEANSMHLSNILEEHSDLAVCYAMKEELCRLFQLRDPVLAELKWNDWFSAAEESNIPALVRFAKLKRLRIEGLIAHAVFPISTGKLEGTNNKIKVAKRVGYGYRDDLYFFTLVRFLSLSPNFP